jgi:tetratricopeptide (TPR) repeat protein
MRAGKLKQAREYFERAVEFTPNYPVLQVNLGIVKSSLGDPETAERHFLRALQLNPDYSQGHYYYARWLVEHERAPEAVAHLERSIEISPGNYNPHRMLLDLHAAIEDRVALAAQVERVLALAPHDPAATAYAEGRVPFEVAEQTAEAYADLGWVRIRDRDWLEAAVLYREALRRDPIVSASWNNLGWALASAGFHDLALPCFERALELDPASELARGNLRWALERQRELHGGP